VPGDSDNFIVPSAWHVVADGTPPGRPAPINELPLLSRRARILVAPDVPLRRAIRTADQPQCAGSIGSRGRSCGGYAH